MGRLIKCGYDKCDEKFLLTARTPHQKYHCKSCGEADRRRWRKPSRIEYMHNYWTTYVRPDQRPSVVE